MNTLGVMLLTVTRTDWMQDRCDAKTKVRKSPLTVPAIRKREPKVSASRPDATKAR